MKAEIGAILLLDEEHQKLPANHEKLGARPGTDSPSQLSKGTNLANTLILD